MPDPKYFLRYFDLRARGEPIRMLFALAVVPFEEERFSLEAWPALKNSESLGKWKL